MAEGSGGSDVRVAKLAMIDVTWGYCRFGPRQRPEDQVWNRYRNLLRGLLAPPEDVGGPGPLTGAWICHEPQPFDDETKHALGEIGINNPIFAPYRWHLQQIQQQGKSHTWRNGEGARQVVERVAEGVEQCGLISTRAWMEHRQALLAAQMNLFACRIYLTPEQAVGLAGTPGPSVPAHVCVDFCFQQHLGRYWFYATLSVWTRKPASMAHAPERSTKELGERNWALSEIRDYYVGTLRAGFKRRVREHFRTAEMEILGREHQPPQFWLAEDAELSAESGTPDDITRFNPLAGALLSAPDTRNTGVAAGVIRERMLVLRRFVPDVGGELPCFLIIPFNGEAAGREGDAWELTRRLTSLEASAAAQLFDVVTGLDLWRTHLRVYEAVADQGRQLWDQLAMYLPVTKGRALNRVRRRIELVHQILLQGIADLDQVAILAGLESRKVERSANALKDQFDRTLTERALEGYQSIRSSLTKMGYFERAGREADRVIKDAAKTERTYKALLEGITLAFDERRAREIDVLQRVGLTLAVAIGAFAFAAEPLGAAFAGWEPATVIAISGFAGAVLTLIVVVLFLRMRRLSTLVTRRFRRRYRKLREFLADCATERLTRLRDAGWRRVWVTLDHPPSEERRVWAEVFAEWDQLDHKLARQCAELLDSLAKDETSPPIWSRPPQLADLARQVDRWALKAMLVSERPREFWQFTLPRLTFFYRFYPMMGRELLSSFNDATDADVVSDADFRFTVSTRCNGRRRRIGHITRWAHFQVEQSMLARRPALHFVEALEEVGLKADMTRTDFDLMLEAMEKQLR